MSISMQVALAVEVDRLRKERDFLGESYDKVCREYVECENLLIEEQQENDRLRAELAELRNALCEYGQHKKGCWALRAEPCDCGLFDALAAKEE